MKKVTLRIPEYLYLFYAKVAATEGSITPEQAMADSLFQLAGELSLRVLHDQGKNIEDI